jgi:hypothetical protein
LSEDAGLLLGVLCDTERRSLDRVTMKKAFQLTDFFFYHAGPRKEFIEFFAQIEQLSLDSLIFAIPT